MSRRLATPRRVDARPRSRRLRAGMSLVEIMIVVAILVGLIAVVVPVGSNLLRVEQRQTVARLGTIYERLRNEALLRNMTFRIAYHLEDRYYEVEATTDQALLFLTPEKRIETEAALQEALDRRPKRPSQSKGDEGGGGNEVSFAVDEEGLALKQANFSAVQDKFLKRFDLPSGIRFGGVYTPAYGELVTPSREDPAEMKPEDKQVVYSYIMPSGVSEHAVIQMVYDTTPNRGFTIEVEPMTGKVHIDSTVREWDRRFSFVPTMGPKLP